MTWNDYLDGYAFAMKQRAQGVTPNPDVSTYSKNFRLGVLVGTADYRAGVRLMQR